MLFQQNMIRLRTLSVYIVLLFCRCVSTQCVVKVETINCDIVKKLKDKEAGGVMKLDDWEKEYLA